MLVLRATMAGTTTGARSVARPMRKFALPGWMTSVCCPRLHCNERNENNGRATTHRCSGVCPFTAGFAFRAFLYHSVFASDLRYVELEYLGFGLGSLQRISQQENMSDGRKRDMKCGVFHASLVALCIWDSSRHG